MFKSVQIKIILITIILSIIIFAIPGYFYINELNSLKLENNTEQIIQLIDVGKMYH